MTDLAVLLPSDPLNERAVDESFARDGDVARDLGLTTLLLDHDRLVGSESAVFIRGLTETHARILYRGWMMPAAA